MRRILALASCAALLSFAPATAPAHVHESADHHEEARGLHVDHGHLSPVLGRDHHRGHAYRHDGGRGAEDVGLVGPHVGHHEGDAIYLSGTARRPGDSTVRPLPAIVAVAPVIDPPVSVSQAEGGAARPRDPPRRFPPRLRAPPA